MTWPPHSATSGSSAQPHTRFAGDVTQRRVGALLGHDGAAQTDQRRHNIVNIVLHSANAGTAEVRAYLMLTSNAGGSPTVIATGFYVFSLERTESEWRIAKLFLGMDNAE